MTDAFVFILMITYLFYIYMYIFSMDDVISNKYYNIFFIVIVLDSSTEPHARI